MSTFRWTLDDSELDFTAIRANGCRAPSLLSAGRPVFGFYVHQSAISPLTVVAAPPEQTDVREFRRQGISIEKISRGCFWTAWWSRFSRSSALGAVTAIRATRTPRFESFSDMFYTSMLD